METKHTPGPWTDAEGVICSDDPSAAICDVFPCDRKKSQITEFHYGPITDANARLIAAAPDLLAALSGLLAVYASPDSLMCCNGRECGCMGATIYQEAEHYAREAIAKATAQML